MNQYRVAIRDVAYVITALPIMSCILLGAFLGFKTIRPHRMKAQKTFSEAGLNGRPMTLTSANGIVLDGYVVENHASDTIVVVTHELGACKEAKLQLAHMLDAMRLNILFFDLRNHGESSNDFGFLNQGERYTDDVECALVEAKRLGYAKVILYAASFSTFPALYVLKRDKIPIDGLILDSGPTLDLDQLIHNYLTTFRRKLLPNIFHGGLAETLIAKTQAKVAMRLFNVHWPSQDRYSIPKLFIVGESDSITKATDVQKLQEYYNNSRLWIVAQSKHLKNHTVATDRYQNELANFIQSI